MAAQENLTLVRSLFDLYNNNRSDPAWLDKSLALFAEDCEVLNVPAATTARSGRLQAVSTLFRRCFPWQQDRNDQPDSRYRT
jgi:hypothetical protein